VVGSPLRHAAVQDVAIDHLRDQLDSSTSLVSSSMKSGTPSALKDDAVNDFGRQRFGASDLLTKSAASRRPRRLRLSRVTLAGA